MQRLRKEEKSAWHNWCDANKPRNGELYDKYKAAKAKFRRELKHAREKYEHAQMQKINESHDMDQKYFWKMVNQSKQSIKTVHPIQINQQLLTDPNDIRNQWKVYFQELYTPQESDDMDNSFKEHVDASLMDMIQAAKNMDPSIMKTPISFQEVSECIKSLNNNKAPGWDSITAEHIKYGGQTLAHALTYLFNAMVAIIHIPKHQKVGVIVPIPKGEKDATIQSNNRGITLLPVVGKIFEKILFERHITWSNDKDPLDPLQGAAQDKCSSLHTTLLLRICSYARHSKLI